MTDDGSGVGRAENMAVKFFHALSVLLHISQHFITTGSEEYQHSTVLYLELHTVYLNPRPQRF